MSTRNNDPFETLMVEQIADDFTALTERPVSEPGTDLVMPGAITARLHSFDLMDQPVLADVPELPGEVVSARTTVALLRAHIGSQVVVVFERGDVRRPIVVGVVQDRQQSAIPAGRSQTLVSVQADDNRLVLSAEREIVLRCGEAAITLTRSGKVVISGTYILSRSKGYNKIKGAAVDIN